MCAGAYRSVSAVACLKPSYKLKWRHGIVWSLSNRVSRDARRVRTARRHAPTSPATAVGLASPCASWHTCLHGDKSFLFWTVSLALTGTHEHIGIIDHMSEIR